MYEKSLLVNRANYDTIQKQDPNCIRNKQKNNNNRFKNSKICWNLLWISILLVTLMFLTSCFLNFYTPHTYDEIFESIEISSKYDLNTYLPVVDLKLKKQKILIETKLNINNTSKMTRQRNSNYFGFLKHVFKSIQSSYKLATVKNEYFKLNTKKFRFDVKKISTHDDNIECFNLSMSKEMKHQRELETCVYLGDHYWFGGHESLVIFIILKIYLKKFQASTCI